MTPTTQTASNGAKEIRTRVKSVFDLDSKTEVSVVKVGTFTPVTTMQEFVDRLSNDSTKILEIINDGLEEFAKRTLDSSSEVPFQVIPEDGGDLTPFTGTALSEEKSVQLTATVLNLAKTLFGYPDIPRGTKQSPEELKANREKKASAKQQAYDFVLGNPGAVELLKK